MTRKVLIQGRRTAKLAASSQRIRNGILQAAVDMRGSEIDGVSKEEDTTTTNAADQYGVVKPSPQPRPVSSLCSTYVD